MERVKALVNRLQEELQQGADTSSLMITVREIQEALLAEQKPVSHGPVARAQNSKVVVVMPVSHQQRPVEPAPAAPEVENTAAKEPEIPPQTDWLHHLMQEIPTLAHQKEIRELNEVMGLQNGASLNDKLKQSSIEVAEVLTREPVRDLKKAIGVNDRFVFVNELFRGDEVMYERSIKTINSFNILQEAEFWMERELKLKLGWDDSKDAVRHFIQLVRRRFSSK
ncbi:hypothetical protein [Flavihumibacter petaseus]|uniref:Uncharacterized protein n=1 Tax=Flavihumibacter petaseus NBRC 106054 TaxID=1220578 RepID=A0A0E9MTW1_9BACT|nr:hypothetical protein [Flavihumibacter petaseus]GAO41217.1 hypothetical protein FPE01S_01_02290 [Flavihumibacter petaseus NBRC 106054]